MRIRSPIRRGSWSRHTSYPTANHDKKTPGEVGAMVKANKKNAENELELKHTIMNNMQRKSISQMDHQRKILEKSMVAYSKKMKEISNSRTNELFRDIHTSNAMREDRNKNTKSLKTVLELETVSDTCSNSSQLTTRSLPDNLQRHGVHARRHSELRTLKGFTQIDLHSPILESSEHSTPELRMSSGVSFGKSTTNSLRSPQRSTKTQRRSPKYQTENKSTDVVETKPNRENAPFHPITTHARLARHSMPTMKITLTKTDASTDTDIELDSSNYSKVAPRVIRHSIPWLANEDSSTDSAYSSGTDDLDSCCSSSVRSSSESLSGDKKDYDMTESEILLTVPKIHVRRKKTVRRRKPSRYLNESLVKQSVLKRVQNFMRDTADVERVS